MLACVRACATLHHRTANKSAVPAIGWRQPKADIHATFLHEFVYLMIQIEFARFAERTSSRSYLTNFSSIGIKPTNILPKLPT